MNTIEFKALAKDSDFSKVTITCHASAHVIVSASLCCDDKSDLFSQYHQLRDEQGKIIKFESIEEALASVHQHGYQGEVAVVHTNRAIGRRVV